MANEVDWSRRSRLGDSRGPRGLVSDAAANWFWLVGRSAHGSGEARTVKGLGRRWLRASGTAFSFFRGLLFVVAFELGHVSGDVDWKSRCDILDSFRHSVPIPDACET